MAVSNIASAWRTRSLLFDGDGAVCGSSRLSPSSIRCEPTRRSLSRFEIEFIMLVMFLVDELLGCIFVSLDSLLMNTTTKHILHFCYHVGLAFGLQSCLSRGQIAVLLVHTRALVTFIEWDATIDPRHPYLASTRFACSINTFPLDKQGMKTFPSVALLPTALYYRPCNGLAYMCEQRQ